jgi:hypothetical protein
MEFLDAWLKEGTNRTLIYVGRDYDAVVDYWQQIQVMADQDQQQEIARRLGLAQSQHDQGRVLMPEQEVGEWFVIRRDHPRRKISKLSGPWNGTIDGAETDIRVQGRLEVPTEDELNSLSKDGQGGQYTYTPLLQGDGIDLAYRVNNSQWGANQVIVVVNGSFLLNLPLVNVQHRRLAGRLIDECRASSRAQKDKVAFIESGPGGPPISAAHAEVGDPEAARRRVLLAVHWVMLGMLYCLSIFPLFGRPKSGPPETVTDFSQHVEAVGALLEKTHDSSYAKHQLEQYRSL